MLQQQHRPLLAPNTTNVSSSSGPTTSYFPAQPSSSSTTTTGPTAPTAGITKTIPATAAAAHHAITTAPTTTSFVGGPSHHDGMMQLPPREEQEEAFVVVHPPAPQPSAKTRFLLEQEFPASVNQSKQAAASRLRKTSQKASGYASLLIEEACRCPHLERYLPHVLDTETVTVLGGGGLVVRNGSNNNNNTRVILANPIHALHFSSQIDDGYDCGGSFRIPNHNNEQLLYGEEQLRTAALSKAGIPEYSYPLTTDSLFESNSSLLKEENTATNTQKNLFSSPPPLPNNKPTTTTTKSGGPIVAGVVASSSSATGTATTVSAKKLPTTTNTTTTKPPTTVSSTSGVSAAEPSSSAAANGRKFEILHHREDQIKSLRQGLFGRRSYLFHHGNTTGSPTKKKSKKRKTILDGIMSSSNGTMSQLLFGSSSSGRRLLSRDEHEQWQQTSASARQKVETWMEHFRSSRRAYYYGSRNGGGNAKPQCHLCVPPPDSSSSNSQTEEDWFFQQQPRSNKKRTTNNNNYACYYRCQDDELMQCLECSFVGCAPTSIAPHSRQHISQHFLLTGHSLAVTCGPRGEVFSFSSGDFVYHEVFDKERFRVDVQEALPRLAWKEYPVQRSFDVLNFVNIEEYGIAWRGPIATYPELVSPEHKEACRACHERWMLFEGRTDLCSIHKMTKEQLEFASFQNSQAPMDRCRINAPVGMYNLGNTCFQSAILQCLVNCMPLQNYFLKDMGNYHKACRIYRSAASNNKSKEKTTLTTAAADNNYNKNNNHNNNKKTTNNNKNNTTEEEEEETCLASELDILFLKYYGSSIGRNVLSILNDDDDDNNDTATNNNKSNAKKGSSSSPNNKSSSQRNSSGSSRTTMMVRGDPLITSDMLTASWKSSDMGHLAGYDQRDAHEFLQAFLDILGKHMRQNQKLVSAAMNRAQQIPNNNNNNAVVIPQQQQQGQQDDIIKQLFEGTLRSVLLCKECGTKRTLTEPFLNVSLPLLNEVLGGSTGSSSSKLERNSNKNKITLERCLEHFTAPEELSDVECPSCKKKTDHKKQHTFSKLPKVLCVHLKRFDAALNKKIEDFVSFPAWGLNLGPHLPHWREVTVVQPEQQQDEQQDGGGGHSNNNKKGGNNIESPSSAEEFFVPDILYDLFGTVNHFGNLQSGHYCTNIKVKDEWFFCNDAHVSSNVEADVLHSDGAYILFYIKR